MPTVSVTGIKRKILYRTDGNSAEESTFFLQFIWFFRRDVAENPSAGRYVMRFLYIFARRIFARGYVGCILCPQDVGPGRM